MLTRNDAVSYAWKKVPGVRPSLYPALPAIRTVAFRWL
jgi:hypothetical protein